MATHTFSVFEFFYDDTFKDYTKLSDLYIDIQNNSTGLNFLNPVRLSATTHVAPVGFQYIDGVWVEENNRVLLTNQYNSENGIYVVCENDWQNNHSLIGDTVVSLESGKIYIKISDYRWSEIIAPIRITPTSWSVVSDEINNQE